MAIENVNNIDKHRSKIVRNRVFDCGLWPDWRQMASKTLFLAKRDPHSSIIQSVFDCHLSDMIKECILWYLKWFSHFSIKLNLQTMPLSGLK